MSNPLYTRLTVMLAKIEADYGVDAVPTVADNPVLVQNLKFKIVPEVLARNNVALPDLSNLPHLVGKIHGELTFDVELRGSGDGDGDVPPDYGAILRMCAMGQTIVAGPGGSVSYNPITDDHESGTIYAYLDGQMQKFLGCMGDWKLVGANTKIGLFSFSMKAKWGGAADVAIVTPTYQNLHPPVCKGITWSYGGWSAPISKWEIDLKNKVVERQDQTEDQGIAGFLITGRDPEAKFDPEMKLLAERDVWTNLVEVNEAALAIALGSTPGNQVAISAPKCAKKTADQGDRDGIATYDITAGLYRTLGNDELTLAFT
jgi:hypothetical protein